MRAPVALDGESEGRAESLRRALRRNDRFGFYLILADGEARTAIVARMQAWGETGDVPAVECFAFGDDGIATLQARLAARGTGAQGWLLPDGDALLTQGGHGALEALNLARDRLWEIVGGPLVLVLAPSLATAFMEAAPDLYEVRRGTWQLRAVAPQRMWELSQEGPAEDPAFLAEWAQRLDEDEREQRGQPSAWVDARIGLAEGLLRIGRMEEAEAQLAHAETLADTAGYQSGRHRAVLTRATTVLNTGRVDEASSVLADLRRRASAAGDVDAEAMALLLRARICSIRGEHHDSLPLLEDARTLMAGRALEGRARIDIAIAQAQKAIGRREVAITLLRDELAPQLDASDLFDLSASTWGLVADMLREHGDLKAAESIFMERVIPTFERAHDPISVASAAIRLGDVLELQGRFEEALRLQRDVALPVFERHRLDRERVIALGKIADVLEQTGDLATALRIRRDDQLPLFERLGDRRSRFLVQERIAFNLAMQGSPQEAYDLLLDDVIPECERLGDPVQLARTWSTVARVLMLQKKPGSALGVLEHDVMPVLRAHHMEHDLAQTQLDAALAQGALGNPAAAQARLVLEVIPTARRLGAMPLLNSATALLRQFDAPPTQPPVRRARRRR